jgi:hypothetical protein
VALEVAGSSFAELLGWTTITVEVISGLFILLGTFVPVTAVPLIIVPLVAIVTVHFAVRPNFGPPKIRVLRLSERFQPDQAVRRRRCTFWSARL